MTAVTYVEGRFPRDPGWWGMLLLIATEAALFLLLLASYFYLRFQASGEWPPEGMEDPTLLKPVIMTVLLTGSSVPAYLADRSVRRGDVERLQFYLAATLVLGAGFLGLQAWEYAEKLDLFRPQTNAYASLFYTITGLHGSHVAVGLVLLVWVLGWSFAGRYGPDRHLAVEVVSLYWHFVHLVWLAVFLSLYISPYL